MSDLLMRLGRHRATAPFIRALGLPAPVELARAAGGYEARPLQDKTVVLGRSAGGHAGAALERALTDAGAMPLEPAALATGQQADVVLLDATGLRTPAACRVLYDGLHPLARQIARNGRVLIAAADPAEQEDPVAAAAARGVEGFSRALGKELGRKGITVNLAYVERAAADRLDMVVRFFCGPQTAYVSGQAFAVTARVAPPAAVPFTQVLAGKVALVTGAARGIGMATATRLAQEGARVVCLDVPAAADDLHQTCSRIGGVPLMLDVAAADAPARLADFLLTKFGGVDVVVHNAGITRDKTLANMPAHYWDQVLGINFAAIAAIDEALLSAQVLRNGGRIVCLSSISGVAGNVGQTNYATSKAALIGYVAARAPQLAARGICINAVAPGFIETPMTDAMPFLMREIGRRLNALQQGGTPRDAAELITFLCTPGAYGISGATIRVCGQGLIGA